MSAEQNKLIQLGLNTIVGQLEDLVKMALEAEKHEVKSKIPFAQIQVQLAEVKKMIDILNSSYQHTIRNMQLSEDDVKRMQLAMIEKNGPERKIFDKLNKMTEQCEEASKRIHKDLMDNKSALSQIQADSGAPNQKKSKKGNSRKDKFKSVGGKKGWMPT